MQYDFRAIEKKWQDAWDEKKPFRAELSADKKKFYGLIEFPYPSADGLHNGHVRPFTAMDVITRKHRMMGENTLFPIGFDAFGLPTENFAIKKGVHPRIVTNNSIANFTRQLKSLGYGFDWERCVDTTDPKYYRWTQWIFIQFFKKGLAYKSEMPINYCPSCKIGLANEEVIDGKCERCGAEVVQKRKSQWMLKITEYAEKLLEGLRHVDFIPRVKTAEINWIGRSEGAEIEFSIEGSDDKLKVFTTRPDTIFGATYMVIAPEHALISKLKDKITNFAEIEKYQKEAAKKSDFERGELNKEKSGVELKGVFAINPLSGAKIPIFVADYVLTTYGTGAIMAVPAHDVRDWEFAKKFSLPITEVISGGDVEKEAFTEEGVMINSDFLNGLPSNEALAVAIKYVEEKKLGARKVNYKLRDWIFSRQHYWGEPIPLIHCEHCGWVPVPDSELPVTLPEVEEFKPGEEGESPLAKVDAWVNTTCPKCGKAAKRETDTMPNWAGSSWYFLRYCDPHNETEFASKEALGYFMAVDWYNGGMEHATLHLLYSRFWNIFLHDLGLVPVSEPYQKRTAHGMILGTDGEKMSKSRGNVINPDTYVEKYGADTLRTYEMFIGPFDQVAAWNDESVMGVHRFLTRAAKLVAKVDKNYAPTSEDLTYINRAIKEVGERIDQMRFNTAVSSLMILLNYLETQEKVSAVIMRDFAKILSPFAPHLAEEIWEKLGEEGFVSQASWPSYDEKLLVSSEVSISVQVNGKLRAVIKVPADSLQSDAEEVAKQEAGVAQFIAGKEIKKIIFVPNKILNFVV